jgi:hypothetical protein
MKDIKNGLVGQLIPISGKENFPNFDFTQGDDGDTLAIDVTNNMLVTVPHWKNLPFICTHQRMQTAFTSGWCLKSYQCTLF